MMFNGVDVLKMQFSRAIDQTFESFLDAWSLPLSEDEARVQGYLQETQFPAEIPVGGPSI